MLAAQGRCQTGFRFTSDLLKFTCCSSHILYMYLYVLYSVKGSRISFFLDKIDQFG